ncbi:MAG: holo-ACP synthase [Nanoarchaeota archaeon]|nr:holo-ACP synthase [Nanoarchaeota archaeon]
MIQGVGIDIESVSRFRKECKNKRFLELIFTNREIAYCQLKKEPFRSFAGKFCAKEAVMKATSERLAMKDIEIRNLSTGKIQVAIHGKAKKGLHCSVSHEERYATACAILEWGN